MKAFLKTLWQFLFSKKGALLLLLGLTLFAYPELVQAEDLQETKESTEQSIASLLAMLMNFLNMLLWPFLIVIGDLMDTDLILGPGMEDRLLSIWVQVRNLVNIAFVLVLLFVAFYNVMGFGGGEGTMALKTALPKIVLGLILVNFTFVLGKVLLDLTNVATTAMFALPEIVEEGNYDFSGVRDEFFQSVCLKQYDEDTGISVYWNKAEKTVPIYTKLFCDVDEEGVYANLNSLLDSQYFQNLNANNVGLVMAVNMGALSSLSVLKEEGIESFGDLSISIMFSVLMYFVFAFTYIALGLVLLTRIGVLWIALALSPLAVLVYVVPQVKEWAGGGGDFTQKIIKQLIAPIIIGATMSLGFLLISGWDEVAGNSALSNSSFKVNQVISTEFLISGIDELPQFIIAIASIVIVWMGVFAAASGTYAEFATNAVRGFGQTVGGFLAKAPLFIPSIPLAAKGEAEPTKYAPMLLFETAKRALQSPEYLFNTEEQMQKLGTSFPILRGVLGGMSKELPEKNLAHIQAALEGAQGGKVTPDQLEALVNPLVSNILVHAKGLSDPAKKTLEKDIRAAARAQNITALKDIINNKKPEELGFSQGLYSQLKEALRPIREVTEAPKEAGPPVPPQPQPPQQPQPPPPVAPGAAEAAKAAEAAAAEAAEAAKAAEAAAAAEAGGAAAPGGPPPPAP